MVRLKHRYLLVNILYPPDASDQPPRATKFDSGKESSYATEFHLQVCRPSANSLTPQILARLIRETVSEMFGDWGMGKLGGAGAGSVHVKYLSPATSTAIIRCPRASYQLVWASLTYLSRLPEPKDKSGGTRDENKARDCVFRVVRVSGTMKKAEQEAIRRARLEVMRMSKKWEEDGKDILQEMFPSGSSEDQRVGIGVVSDDEDDEDDSDG